MKVYRKRGYVKWTDEDGKKHKVPEAEYDAALELNDKEDIQDSEDDVPEYDGDGFV